MEIKKMANKEALKYCLQQFINGVQTGAITSDHDETLANLMGKSIDLLKPKNPEPFKHKRDQVYGWTGANPEQGYFAECAMLFITPVGLILSLRDYDGNNVEINLPHYEAKNLGEKLVALDTLINEISQS
jgi:hypothetical protein